MNRIAILAAAFAMTEIGHGSNVQRLETTITYDAATDELVVNSPTPTSAKTYIGNADQWGDHQEEGAAESFRRE